ncbi:MAG: C40 family peptidase [Rickettsiales bacterium]|jgi:hypothetical protein|nr:C40 family peptidase [Rickettsiales bacterium]
MRRKINSRKILRVAKTWLNTKFHHSGRIKINAHNGGGIDCIGLILKIGEEIDSTYNGKSVILYDYLTYSKYPNHGEMKMFLDKYFIKITLKQARAGDLIYFNFRNKLEHIAVISDVGIIHCYLEVRRVVEHPISAYWKEKIIGYYRYSNT